MKRFQDQTILVTGASRGLGRAIAVAFAEQGAWVTIGYRNNKAAAAVTLASVLESGGTGEIVALDVTNRTEIEQVVSEIQKERGGIDVLINNAGVIDDKPFAIMDSDAWDDVLHVNLTGAYNMCRAVVRPMIRNGGGTIVNIGSVAGHRASPNQANYSASKGGLAALTRTLASELAPRGIRVNSVSPGFIDEGMLKRTSSQIVEQMLPMIPAGRLGNAKEVASTVLFLAGPEASYIVGQCVLVDGGLSA